MLHLTPFQEKVTVASVTDATVSWKSVQQLQHNRGNDKVPKRRGVPLGMKRLQRVSNFVGNGSDQVSKPEMRSRGVAEVAPQKRLQISGCSASCDLELERNFQSRIVREAALCCETKVRVPLGCKTFPLMSCSICCASTMGRGWRNAASLGLLSEPAPFLME